MSLWWPNQLKPNPDSKVWVGRTLHWLGAVCGSICLILGLWMCFVAAVSEFWHGTFFGPIALFGGLVVGATVYLVGRAFRYVLSGE